MASSAACWRTPISSLEFGQVAHQCTAGRASAAGRSDQLIVQSRDGIGAPNRMLAFARGALGLLTQHTPRQAEFQARRRGCRDLVRPFQIDAALRLSGIRIMAPEPEGLSCRFMSRSTTSRATATTARCAEPADRAAAAGAALPHARAVVLAEGRRRARHFINWQQDPQATIWRGSPSRSAPRSCASRSTWSPKWR